MTGLAFQPPKNRVAAERIARFCTSSDQARAVHERLRAFSIFDLQADYQPYEHQLSALYQSQSDWKYEPATVILNQIGKLNYHILIVIPNDSDVIAGTVRAFFFPRSNLVYGSCLVTHKEFRKGDLSIPLIYAAMTVADDDSIAGGANGIKGAVLGVDNHPLMRRFHDKWGVRFIHHSHLPFVTPKIAERTEQTRTIGLRLPVERTEISSEEVALILDELRSFQLEIGYHQESVDAVHRTMASYLKPNMSFPLLTAHEYTL